MHSLTEGKTQQTEQLAEIYFLSHIKNNLFNFLVPRISAELIYYIATQKPDWYTKSHNWPLVQQHLVQRHEKVHYICT